MTDLFNTAENWKGADEARLAGQAVTLEAEIHEAEAKAIDALARYKFTMFGYWAGIWVHLNRIEGKKRPNPFKDLVLTAREIRAANERSAA